MAVAAQEITERHFLKATAGRRGFDGRYASDQLTAERALRIFFQQR
jgi:hypothetical protein